VLTLSATEYRPRYAIDPRFPLFQQALPAAKRSHTALAQLFGVPDLVQPVEPIQPDTYTDDLCDIIVNNWLTFNRGFTDLALKKFDKYAVRLNEEIMPANRQGPTWILPPYFTARADDQRWWPVSRRLWQRAQQHAAQGDQLVRVVATDTAALLGQLLANCPESQLAVWISQLDEAQVDDVGREDLTSYGQAIRAANQRGQKVFALYGGFFSVLLGIFGLAGSSHGIGYGEARTWQELPQSGPPPARYYLPRAHRYVSMDLALLFWRENRQLVECDCAECDGQSPARLDYHGLMHHSVRCRTREIQDWLPKPPEQAVTDLSQEAGMFEDAIAAMYIPNTLRRPADRCATVLRGWARVVGALAR
jgi:hypothetical protein